MLACPLITRLSDNSISDLNDTCVGSSSVFNNLRGTPPSAKITDGHIFTTPEQMIKRSSKSSGTLTKIMAEGDLVDMSCLLRCLHWLVRLHISACLL